MKQLFSIILFTAFTFVSRAQSDSLLYKIKEASNKNNQVLLILLHGYGSNEDDLLQLAQFFPDNWTVVSPRAGFTLQAGAYQWYESIHSGKSFDGKKEDLDKSHQLIKNLVLRLKARLHINASHTFIAGFSQGANMSYQMGLLYPGLCKGIGVFSGTLFDSQKGQILQAHNTSLAIFAGHGTQDNRIPYANAESSKQWLEAKRFKPEFHAYTGMSHSISPQEIQDFISFIHKTVNS